MKKKVSNPRFYLGVLSALIFFVFAQLRVAQHQSKLEQNLLPKGVENYSVRISEKNTAYKFNGIITSVCINGSWNKVNSSVILFSKDSLGLELGDEIVIKGKPGRLKSTQNPNEFDFAGLMASRGVFYHEFLTSYKVLRSNDLSFWNAKLLQAYLSNKLELFVQNKNSFQIANSLLLGSKQGLGKKLKNDYVQAGIIHVLAVSGLHVGIVYLCVSYLFSFLGKRRGVIWVKSVVLLSLIWGYSYVTGLSVPIVRASCMLSVFIIAEMLNKKPVGVNVLCFSALLMLAYNPYYLYEIGFQYSFLAIGGILILYPHISKWVCSPYWLVQKSWELIAVSISAQLFLFPLSVYYFHQFSNYFLLSNLLILPLVGIIVPMGFLFFLASPIPFVQKALGYLLDKHIQLVNFIVEKVVLIPGAVSQDLIFSLPQCIGLFVLILFVVLSFLHRKKNYVYLSLGVSVFLFSSFLICEFSIRNQKRLISYAIPNYLVTDIVLGRSMESFVYPNNKAVFSKMKYSVLPNRKALRVVGNSMTQLAYERNDNYDLVCYDGRSYFFPKRRPYLKEFLDLDYFFLLSNRSFNPKIKSKKIIYHGKERYSDEVIFSVKQNGAYIRNL